MTHPKEMKKTHRISFSAPLLSLSISGLLIALAPLSTLYAKPQESQQAVSEEEGVEYALALSSAFERAAQRITPAVVNIQTRSTASA